MTAGAGRQECLRTAFRGDTTADTTEIGDALDQWTALLPAGAASLQRGKGIVTLTACDTAGTTAPGQDTLDIAVGLLANRNELVLEFLGQQAPILAARCVADRVVVDPEIEPLFTKATLTDDDKTLVQDRVQRYISECRSA